MTKFLVIYDNSGNVWAQYAGYETVPSGIQGMIVNVPANHIVKSINMTTMTAVLEYAPTQKVTVSEVENLQNAIIELEARVAELEG